MPISLSRLSDIQLKAMSNKLAQKEMKEDVTHSVSVWHELYNPH